MTLQMRIKELEEEGARLRTLVDETYIAGSLLGLRDSFNQDGETVVVKTASSICGNFYELQCASQLLSKEDEKKDCNEAPTPVPSKRIRRTGRYDPQEREKKRCNILLVLVTCYIVNLLKIVAKGIKCMQRRLEKRRSSFLKRVRK